MWATCAAHHAQIDFAPAFSAKMQLVLEISRADVSVNEGNRAHSWCFELLESLPTVSFVVWEFLPILHVFTQKNA